MSRAYEMRIIIENCEPARLEAIQAAVEEEWPLKKRIQAGIGGKRRALTQKK